jgi:hypothetical protein
LYDVNDEVYYVVRRADGTPLALVKCRTIFKANGASMLLSIVHARWAGKTSM